MDEIMSLALESGIWAALFCFLFLYMLKDSRSREKKYTITIEKLSRQLGDATWALRVCEEIKESCQGNVEISREIKSNTEHIQIDIDALRSSWERL